MSTLLDNYWSWMEDNTHMRAIEGWYEITTPYLDRRRSLVRVRVKSRRICGVGERPLGTRPRRSDLHYASFLMRREAPSTDVTHGQRCRMSPAAIGHPNGFGRDEYDHLQLGGLVPDDVRGRLRAPASTV
jgi:hypothetical protein